MKKTKPALKKDRIAILTFLFLCFACASTSLVDLSKKGDVAALKEALDEGADVNEKDSSGWTSLMWVSKNGKLEIVKFLLENQADVNLIEDKGNTAFAIATENNNFEIAKILESAALKQESEAYAKKHGSSKIRKFIIFLQNGLSRFWFYVRSEYLW